MTRLALILALALIATPVLAEEIEGVNWLRVSISVSGGMGKHSSASGSVYGGAFKTKAECEKPSWPEEYVCLPIPALPDIYWTDAAINTGVSP
ncbi:hypothetical protein [Taklimakanibacter deserti]|uniref:hypothetical protein n=1 Tax=Taklimakanibacter deserti TaxID=2267839 RepID=UPI000E65627D